MGGKKEIYRDARFFQGALQLYKLEIARSILGY